MESYPSVLLEIDNIVEVSVYGALNPLMGKVVAARINLSQNEAVKIIGGDIQY